MGAETLHEDDVTRLDFSHSTATGVSPSNSLAFPLQNVSRKSRANASPTGEGRQRYSRHPRILPYLDQERGEDVVDDRNKDRFNMRSVPVVVKGQPV